MSQDVRREGPVPGAALCAVDRTHAAPSVASAGRGKWAFSMIALLFLALGLALAHPVRAEFEAGQRAWDAGQTEEALTEWRAAAGAGDRRAMLALGRLHLQGLGVVQDYVEAHKWLNLAASRGEAAALEERDALASKMTPAQVAAAQERAAAWRPGASGAEGTTDATAAQATPAASAPAATAAQATAATPAPASAPAAERPPPEAIREAQALLGALGYRPGPADGVWGRRTGAAYRAFLRDAGLPAAETLTPETLLAMRTIAERAGGGTESARGTTVAADPGKAPREAEPPRPAAIPPEALHQAAQTGDIEILKAALASGVDVDARDGRGWTALMHAVNNGYPLLVEPLLAANADPDVRAPDGATALFMAAAHGHTEIIALLMKAGADVSIRGPKGKTAVEVARTRYGDEAAARKKGEDAALVALLAGRPLSEEEKSAERLARKWPHGKKFRDCAECPEMVVVRSGSFDMGSPSGEVGRRDDEGPVHRVEISRPFAVGVYEVTFAEWDACVSGGGCNGYRPNDRGWGRGNRPVIYVSWEDAKAYVEWLSRKTRKGYRLLSESEWEYVARAGTRTRYWWGDSVGRNRANCDGCGSRWDNEKTSPAGSFSANGFGLYDMHGNVWEWVEDCWHDSYRGAPSDGSAWVTFCDNVERVLRGGSWYLVPRFLRSASRHWRTAGSRNLYDGFRVARTLD